ncbi:MAG: enoyl-CoA hydratase/isomerase family protein [Rhodothermales bacterium]
MVYDTLLVEVDDHGIATVTINRPDKLNALNAQVIEDLDAFFALAQEDEAIRGVILTGAGSKSFVAGADIARFQELDGVSGKAFAERGQAVFNRIENLPKPVIAAVNGFALGGGSELALACHLRIASDTAVFGQPEVNLGILPGYGATQRLPRLVGLGIATELILTGSMIKADRAYEIGLVNRLVPADDLMASARDMMGTILSKAPLAVAGSLRALREADQPLSAGLQTEATLFGEACDTADFKEGVAAFLEKRKASFSGR